MVERILCADLPGRKKYTREAGAHVAWHVETRDSTRRGLNRMVLYMEIESSIDRPAYVSTVLRRGRFWTLRKLDEQRSDR